MRVSFFAADRGPSRPRWLSEEAREIEVFVRRLAARVRPVFQDCWTPCFSDVFHAVMDDMPAIVHFIARETGPSGGLLFRADEGDVSETDDFGQSMFQFNFGVRVVVLDGCYCSEQARSIAEFIGCVIGVDRSGGDRLARRFAAVLYSELVTGLDVQEAFERGRRAIEVASPGSGHLVRLVVRSGLRASGVAVGARAGFDRRVRASVEQPGIPPAVTRLVEPSLPVASWRLVLARYRATVLRYCEETLADRSRAEEVCWDVLREVHAGRRQLIEAAADWVMEIARRHVFAANAKSSGDEMVFVDATRRSPPS